MSLTTINQAATDEALLVRIDAGVWKEALNNPAYGDTSFGRMVIGGSAPTRSVFPYPVAVANEAAYESAVVGGNPDPGGDPAVITDADITAAIQANWPPDTTSPPS
jgi:hypothetical protein